GVDHTSLAASRIPSRRATARPRGVLHQAAKMTPFPEASMTPHRIAVMPGDGIGKEVVPEGLRTLEAAARKFAIPIEWREFDWSCDYYAKHGRMMPEDWFETLSPHDAIFYGAVGWPAIVPDHISL